MCLPINLLLMLFAVACTPKHTSSIVTKPVERDNLDYLRKEQPSCGTVLIAAPVSGANAEAGAEVIHACMLATENIRNINFQVLNTASHYMDSKHFPKLKGVIGPIFSSEARRYGTLFAHVPVLALSNDRALDDGHLYACGLSPQDEIRTIIEYGKSRKIESFLVILPEGDFPDKILNMFQNELQHYDYDITDNIEVIRYTNLSETEAMTLVRNSGKQAVFLLQPILSINSLSDIPVFTLSSCALLNKEAWDGAIFAFTDNAELSDFTYRYQQTAGTAPSTLAIVAYDMMKALCNHIESGSSLSDEQEGCLGKFKLNGKKGVERSLSILQLVNGTKIQLDNDENDEVLVDTILRKHSRD